MSKVTYLLGAGASAGTYPVVDDMANAIGHIARQLNGIVNTERGKTDRNNELMEQFEIARKDMVALQEGCEGHLSIDTYLRKLFLSARDKSDLHKYHQAKSSIVLFFELYRYYSKTIDKRYDAFLAALLKEGDLTMPDSMNIVSWNYDYEIERAYKNYDNRLLDIDQAFNVLNISYKNSRHCGDLRNKFGIVKINGTIGYHNQEYYQKIGLGARINSEIVEYEQQGQHLFPIIQNYIELTYNNPWMPSISFAWDQDSGERKIMENLKHAVEETELLIVIGYSFPYFNREIDRMLFNNLVTMKRKGYKIIVQDPYNAESIIENIMGLNNTIRSSSFNIKLDKKQFYIPHELK
ncbi:MAG: hypothetical protein K0Q79_3626 [Flavipsychrobacter sp.]|jgi:hypothetical protein|nr:hypothetical protein [Flavipsychrobacter sp.]